MSRSGSVRPYNTWVLFRSSSFSSVKSLLVPVEDHLVRDFSLAVALWVCRGGVDVSDAQLLAEIFEEVGTELSHIV